VIRFDANGLRIEQRDTWNRPMGGETRRPAGDDEVATGNLSDFGLTIAACAGMSVIGM
jgi:hypothetical protein